MGITAESTKEQMSEILKNLYNCFIERDAELIEIYPLTETRGAKLVATCTKIIIDDNALYRQAELKSE